MENNQSVPVPTDQPPIVQEPTPVSTAPPGRGKRKITFIIIGVTLLLLVALFFVLVLSKKLTIPSVIVSTPTVVPSVTIQPLPTGIIPTSTNPIVELTLVKGKEVAIPNTDMTILYVGPSAPNPKCVDCSTTTDILLRRAKNEQKLSYVCGGIAGTCADTLVGFGYSVMLGKVTETTVQVKIQKQ